MNLSQQKGTAGLMALGKPTSTGVSGNATIGLETRTTQLPSASIIGAMKATAAANGNVATLTLATLALAATTGSPTIADGDGKDFEGNTFPSLAKIQGLLLRTGSGTGDVTIAGSSSGRLPAITMAPNQEVLVLWGDAGQTLSAATLTATFASAGQSLEIAVIGKDA